MPATATAAAGKQRRRVAQALTHLHLRESRVGAMGALAQQPHEPQRARAFRNRCFPLHRPNVWILVTPPHRYCRGI